MSSPMPGRWAWMATASSMWQWWGCSAASSAPGCTMRLILYWESFQGNLSKILDIRREGLPIYGGILGGAAGRRHRHGKAPQGCGCCPALDLAAGTGFLKLASRIGRWGNFVNRGGLWLPYHLASLGHVLAPRCPWVTCSRTSGQLGPAWASADRPHHAGASLPSSTSRCGARLGLPARRPLADAQTPQVRRRRCSSSTPAGTVPARLPSSRGSAPTAS